MTIYYLLYIVILFCFAGERFFSFGKKMAFVIISSFIACIVGLRSENMGYDVPGYLASFGYLSDLSLEDAFQMSHYLNYERGYIFFNAVLGKFTTDVHAFLFICAFLSFIPVAFFAYKNSENFSQSMIVYLFLPPFLLLYSGLRQSLAIGLCVFALEFVVKRRLIPFLLIVFLATLFHTSAFLFVIVYPIYTLKFDLKQRFFSVGILFIVFILKNVVFAILARLLSSSPAIDNNGAMTLMLFFVVIYVFCFLLSNQSEKENGFLNIFFIACFCQMFSSLNSIAMRVGYYFMYSLIFLIPVAVDHFENKNGRMALSIVVYSGLVVCGLYLISTGTWAQANPHHWFWD